MFDFRNFKYYLDYERIPVYVLFFYVHVFNLILEKEEIDVVNEQRHPSASSRKTQAEEAK